MTNEKLDENEQRTRMLIYWYSGLEDNLSGVNLAIEENANKLELMISDRDELLNLMEEIEKLLTGTPMFEEYKTNRAQTMISGDDLDKLLRHANEGRV